MAPPLPRDPRASRAILLVGPGPRAADLAHVLAALGTPRSVEARAFADLADLGLESGRAGALVLDVDATPVEDVGYVRRFLVAHAGFELVLVGTDSRARTVRVLGARRFLHWPPDVEELAALVASVRRADAPAIESTTRTSAPRGAPSHARSTAADDEIELVRSILEPEALDRADLASARDDEPVLGDRTSGSRREFQDLFGDELPADDADDDDDDEPTIEAPPARVSESDSDEAAAIPPIDGLPAPTWWRAQVADLADAAQRIDLSLRVLARAAPLIDQGDHEEAHTRLRELEAEVARLLQFTRTLGYVASPPPAGTQVFDLGEMVHIFAAGLAASGPDAPRCQFKTTPGAEVRSDRQLLNQALDAVFFLVRCTSRKGDLVRAQIQRIDDEEGAFVELALDFPSGPLEGFGEDELVAPYGLADLFPDLGPNALAAARGIVAGQGGRLALASRARGRMTWRLRLPRPAH